MSERFCRTSPQQNTPLKNPLKEELTEIEVTDPTHPLFGRHFSALSISSPPQGEGNVLVVYKHMALRVPVSATNLAPARPGPRTKLTLEAVAELVSLVEECEVICQCNPSESGSACPQSSNNQSLTS
jgi:hypothetical protein